VDFCQLAEICGFSCLFAAPMCNIRSIENAEDMPKPPYVVERAGSRNLYCRRRFPEDVAAYLAKTMISGMLTTS
jgi:hypothetical protein